VKVVSKLGIRHELNVQVLLEQGLKQFVCVQEMLDLGLIISGFIRKQMGVLNVITSNSEQKMTTAEWSANAKA